jgi:hypothetical protein
VRATLSPHKTRGQRRPRSRRSSKDGAGGIPEEGRWRHAPKVRLREASTSYAGPHRASALFNIREGAMWAGVLQRHPAYTTIDVTWVRTRSRHHRPQLCGNDHRVTSRWRSSCPTRTPPRTAPRLRHAVQHGRAHRSRKKKL